MTEPTQEPASPGALLRAAREKQGLHIAALAAAIKVSPRKLDALENDRWDELPDATFTRALAQTVCRTLKVDPRPVLDKLPAAAPVMLETQDAGLNTPFRDRPGRVEPGLTQSAVKPMVLGAVLLMAAAVLVYLLPSDLLQRRPAVVAPAASAASAAQGAASAAGASVVSAAVPGADAASAPAPGAAAAPAFMPDAASAPGAGEPTFVAPPAASVPNATAPLAAAPAPAAAPMAAAAPPAPAAATAGPLQLRATQSSWVEVRDGRGNTLLSRTVVAGESLALDGALPLRLTIGNAAGTQLLFKGQPVDLATRTRDNVARVELP